ncbi:chloride channel protein [Bombella saccharophila]|uniref:Chloride channel protein n=1 Tax=Bombella saccharophila TaxID=2967338 RepID=A0ABT3W5P1_9PROT|nr:chloride channel protein [Bombella saccharophila]MCX5613714.1 chloride channel protein [Bombella saccharophila]
MKRRNRITRFRRSARTHTTHWQRSLIFWAGAITVGIIAWLFARAADYASSLCLSLTHWNPYIMLVIIPSGLALSMWLTKRFFPGAQGSGIPQTIATLHIEDFSLINRILALRIAFGKICLTTLGLLCGASIGREGPTVQVGAAIMHAYSRFLGHANVSTRRGVILAGGAAGVAAAFNTPLAGIVFAIEELSSSFHQRTSGFMLTGVVIAGVTAIVLTGGNYTYFGHASVDVPVGTAWIAVLACGILGGLGGGAFSAFLIRVGKGLPGKIGRIQRSRPVLFTALCGVLLAILGIASHGETFGTGYIQAHHLVDGSRHGHMSYFLMKYAATIISYCSGIPGGLFAPSLSIGASVGGWVARFLPHTAPGAVVLLGMVGYFSGVVQSPLTATVIVMEMCDNQQITLALLATAFLALGVSRMVCSHSLYGQLADQFLARQEGYLQKQHDQTRQASSDHSTPEEAP